jgi:hypothetical protein
MMYHRHMSNISTKPTMILTNRSEEALSSLSMQKLWRTQQLATVKAAASAHLLYVQRDTQIL